VAAVLYGAYTAWARHANPQQFWKIDPMKRAYGPRAGVIIHVIGYTIVPIIVGIVLIIRGLQGGSIF
jgi:hypothetical protein